MTYSAMASAKQGTTTLVFNDVKPGTYALQVFHDEDGNMFPNIPPEGYAFGNSQQFPPSYEGASLKVAGDTTHVVAMTYMQDFSAAQPPKGGSKGAPAPAGVTKTDVREDGLYGQLYMPAHDRPLPAIISLGGSEGGLDGSSRVSAPLSTKGYAVLALAYFAEQGLPQTLENVPLEYFDKAVDWLRRQPGIDPDAIGVMGGSRGSEAALLLASRNSHIKAVAAYAPSGIVWQGLNFSNPMNMGPAWTAEGKPLPFVIPNALAYRPNAPMRDMFVKSLDYADRTSETAIPVEKISGPVLLVSGKADALWPSYELSERIVKRLKDKGFAHAVTHLSYDDVGHGVFFGDPSTPAAISFSQQTPSPMMGGTGPAGLAAWQDNWPKTVAFFDKALKGPKQ